MLKSFENETIKQTKNIEQSFSSQHDFYLARICNFKFHVNQKKCKSEKCSLKSWLGILINKYDAYYLFWVLQKCFKL